MNLYAIYIGGSHEKSLIELHDMRFILAETIEDTYEELKAHWWGTPDSLHLDAWGILRYVDGYEIQLKNEPPHRIAPQLYFINLGGYDNNQFTELHKNIFLVADDEKQAKSQALKQITAWQSPHRDYQFEIEKIITVQHELSHKNRYIHLQPGTQQAEFEFICQYVPIGK